MTEVKFVPREKVAAELFEYAVIAARYEDKWVYVRNKNRDTWEIPGGKREAGERIEETARRELMEESGALEMELLPVSAYCVVREGEEVANAKRESYGMLYWAQITRLGELPEEFEIGELMLTDVMPKKLTYPEIQPRLYHYVQGWLSMRTGQGELWDIYDADRNLTGRQMRRGEPILEGDYHLVVHVWMLNKKGEFLITKRSPNKGFPNMWETTGGSALSGDSSLEAAMREVKEETGLTLLPQKGSRIITYRGSDHFSDVWLFQQDFDLKDVVLQEGETCDVMYAAPEKIRQLWEEGLFCEYNYFDKLWEIADGR